MISRHAGSDMILALIWNRMPLRRACEIYLWIARPGNTISYCTSYIIFTPRLAKWAGIHKKKPLCRIL